MVDIPPPFETAALFGDSSAQNPNFRWPIFFVHDRPDAIDMEQYIRISSVSVDTKKLIEEKLWAL